MYLVAARLFGSLLYRLQLRILHIEDTPIEKIEEHTFLGVNNTLNELYVLNSVLDEFPASAFKVSETWIGIKINCSSNPSCIIWLVICDFHLLALFVLFFHNLTYQLYRIVSF